MAGIFRKFEARAGPSAGRRRWLIFALAVFVLADIALVFWALSAHKATPSTEAPNEPSQTTTSAAPPSDSFAAPAVRPRRLLAVLDTDTAWRATTGKCPTDLPTLQITTDAGENWTASI